MTPLPYSRPFGAPCPEQFSLTKDFCRFPVFRHFPYSRDFVVFLTLLEKVERLKGKKVGRLEGERGFVILQLFPDTFEKGWKGPARA